MRALKKRLIPGFFFVYAKRGQCRKAHDFAINAVRIDYKRPIVIFRLISFWRKTP